MTFVQYSLLICSSLLVVRSMPPKENNDVFCQKPMWHMCGNGRCLSAFFTCDGENDCGDNTDELNCTHQPIEHINIECTSEQFKCADNYCIPLDDFCNRQQDCPDGSDEYIGCTSNKTCNEFRCKNGYCVKNEWVCDGIDDCNDFSDESNCGNRTVSLEQCNNQINRFLCNNGRCMPLNKTCDAKDDCGDNSDENEMGCKIAAETCRKGNICSHTCHNTPKGPSCSCPVGHKMINNRTCIDINECTENPELCDQGCVNTVGSYYCICKVGFELQDDKKTCTVEVPHERGQYYIYASRSNVYLGGTSAAKVPTGFASSHANRKLDADYVVTEGIGAHKLHVRALSWGKARRTCVEEGGHLAVIRTELEETILREMMTKKSINHAWVGYSDIFEEGDWFSVLEEPIAETGWARWSTKVPINPIPMGGHCGELKAEGGLVNENCKEERSFICKVSTD